MEFKDYYKTLSVERGADRKAISAAYRRLARQHHPDVNKSAGAEDRFKEINEAYQVLGDPQKRARYDQMYEAYQRGGMDWQQIFGGAPWQQSPRGWTVVEGSPEDLEDLLGGIGGFSDFFRQFFGGAVGGMRPQGRRPAGRERGGRAGAPASGEASAAIEITLDEAFRGTQKLIGVQVNGARRNLTVTIPKGVRDGQRMRLAGALDGADLYLTVQVKADPRFERRGDDLVTEVPLPLTDVLLGTAIQIPTFEGPVEMAVPPETQNGQVFRLRGQGMPRRDGGRGDQLVRITVVLPTKLNARERELVQELARLRKETPRTH